MAEDWSWTPDETGLDDDLPPLELDLDTEGTQDEDDTGEDTPIWRWRTEKEPPC